MSLDINTVTRVLLADGWHDVINNTFEVSSYEFTDPPGQDDPNPATGFTFIQGDQTRISGPLTAIVAVIT